MTLARSENENEMNRALGHFCAHIGLIGPREPPEEDGEMSEMTLPSRHRIRNPSPGGLSSSTLPLGHGGPHNTEFYEWMGKKHFGFIQTTETGKRTPNPARHEVKILRRV